MWYRWVGWTPWFENKVVEFTVGKDDSSGYGMGFLVTVVFWIIDLYVKFYQLSKLSNSILDHIDQIPRLTN